MELLVRWAWGPAAKIYKRLSDTFQHVSGNKFTLAWKCLTYLLALSLCTGCGGHPSATSVQQRRCVHQWRSKDVPSRSLCGRTLPCARSNALTSIIWMLQLTFASRWIDEASQKAFKESHICETSIPTATPTNKDASKDFCALTLKNRCPFTQPPLSTSAFPNFGCRRRS